MNEQSYIKIDCKKVIELVDKLIHDKNQSFLEEINTDYQNFTPPKKWFKKDKFIYDKSEKLTDFKSLEEIKNTHPSIYHWVYKYCRYYSFTFDAKLCAHEYFYVKHKHSSLKKIKNFAQFSLDHGDVNMYLGMKDAEILGIC